MPTARTLLRSTRALLAAACLAGGMAHAEPVGWQCWDNDDTTVGCRLDAATVWQARDSDLAPVPQAPAGAEDPLRRLPPFVRMLRERPAEMAGRVVRIPMHGPLLDAAFAHELAQSVMCGPRQDCAVRWISRPDAFVALTDDALED